MKWTKPRIALVSAGAVLAALLAAGLLVEPEAPPQVVETPPLPVPEAGGIPPETAAEIETLSRGTMLFIFFHEAGHMLISELGIPATGPEEDVVDEFATFVLTDALKAAPEEEKAVYAQIVMSGAIFWRIAAETAAQQGSETPWFDEHSPDLRRYATILCLATGADPLRFIPLAVKDGMPENRLAECAREYERKHAAWDQLMAPHAPGMMQRLFGSGRLTLEYGPAMKSEWLAFENAYRQGGFFQQVLDSMGGVVALPRDIPVLVQGCGFENAYWSPGEARIVLCHDMFARVVGTFAQSVLAARQAQAQDAGQGGGAPAPPPGGGAPSPLPAGGAGGGAAALAGVWACQSYDLSSGAPISEQLVLQGDGHFRSTSQNMMTGFALDAWGRWSFTGGALRYDLAGFEPRQFCGPLGCTPVMLGSPMVIPVQAAQPGTLQMANGSCTKTG